MGKQRKFSAEEIILITKMRREEGKTLEEIADFMGCSVYVIKRKVKNIKLTPEQKYKIRLDVYNRGLNNFTRKNLPKPKKEIVEKARELRSIEGMSVKRIAKQIGAAYSSVSVWTRDIVLTEEQLQDIREHSKQAASIANSSRWRDIREQLQQMGEKRVKNEDAMFIAGCMLYWGEGSKGINQCQITNSDLAMMKFFIKFIKECFGKINEDFALTLNIYTDIHTQEEIESHWLEEMELPRGALNKSQVNKISKASKGIRKGKSEWGTCRLSVKKSVGIVQQIYGAIQKYANFENPKWLG